MAGPRLRSRWRPLRTLRGSIGAFTRASRAIRCSCSCRSETAGIRQLAWARLYCSTSFGSRSREASAMAGGLSRRMSAGISGPSFENNDGTDVHDGTDGITGRSSAGRVDGPNRVETLMTQMAADVTESIDLVEDLAGAPHNPLKFSFLALRTSEWVQHSRLAASQCNCAARTD